MLYQTVQAHLASFLDRTTGEGGSAGLPTFVLREFEAYLRCGILAHGFVRVRCRQCVFEHLVPFSCKGRGFCPSCGGRRMTERAAHLVEAVLPWVPVRQWVLTVPHRLRYRLAWDHGLTRRLLRIYARTLEAWYVREARGRGLEGGRTGMLTVIQRFGSGANLHVHFHTLVLDGVFRESAAGELVFHAAWPPSDLAVAEVLATVRRRMQRFLARRGLEPGPGDPTPADDLAETAPVLAQLVGAAVQGRIALGPRAGARVGRLGRGPEGASRSAPGPRQAHEEGFDLHANVWVPPRDRARLEHLCRYLLRAPLAQERLQLRQDGNVLLTLKVPWRDGTTALCFEPLEFLGRLAALTPRPEINLLIYHGVLAPNARWRHRIVRYGRSVEGGPVGSGETGADSASTRWPRRNWTWAALMRRAFALDVLVCRRCGGPLQTIGTVEDPQAVRAMLVARGLAGAPPVGPGPPHPP